MKTQPEWGTCGELQQGLEEAVTKVKYDAPTLSLFTVLYSTINLGSAAFL